MKRVRREAGFAATPRLPSSALRGGTRRNLSVCSLTTIGRGSRIAVIGGGLAGLATVKALFKLREDLTVEIFDIAEHPGDGGATRAAAGLLHPFTPRVKTKCWRADEGMATAQDLLADACKTRTMGKGIVMSEAGILRLARTEAQSKDYRLGIERFGEDELEWWTPRKVIESVPGVAADELLGAVMMKHGMVVNAATYCQGLFDCMIESGLRIKWRRVETLVTNLAALQREFDAVLLTGGAGCKAVEEFQRSQASTDLSLVRGQNIVGHTGEQGNPKFPLICGKYFIPTGSSGFLAGATFESRPEDCAQLVTLPADAGFAEKELKDPISSTVFDLTEATVVSATAGVRALPPRTPRGSVPLAGRLDSGAWFLTGLGARGLLYHGVMGQLVAQAMLSGDPSTLQANSGPPSGSPSGFDQLAQ